MRFFSKFYILLFLFFPFFINAEELRDVLRDAYNYYPDVKKSKKDLENARKDRELQIEQDSLLILLHPNNSKPQDHSS